MAHIAPQSILKSNGVMDSRWETAGGEAEEKEVEEEEGRAGRGGD